MGTRKPRLGGEEDGAGEEEEAPGTRRDLVPEVPAAVRASAPLLAPTARCRRERVAITDMLEELTGDFNRYLRNPDDKTLFYKISKNLL